MSFSTYPQTSSDWNFRKWLVPMLLASLLIHFGLGVFFQLKKLNTFVPVVRERLIPRQQTQLSQVRIDPKLLQTPVLPETTNAPTKPIPDIAPVQITEPKRSFAELSDEILATPASAELTKPLLNEKPKIDPARVNAALNQLEQRGSLAIDREMDNLRKELISEKPNSLNQPALRAQGLSDSSAPLTDTTDGNSASPGDAGPDGTAGFSNLDQLITQTGPLTSGTAPILMPTDLLYDYDSYILREGAVSSLSNLGKLIQKNPQATFIIEGYTDSFGAAAYNKQLSLNRAEGVKNWLLQNMAIDPGRVQTRGFGSTKLLVPATKSMEEQQLNRRVEIVIKTRQR